MVNLGLMTLLVLLAFVGIGMAVATVPLTTEVLAQGNMTGNMTANMTDMGSGNVSALLGAP
jgi:hypothetical protein